MAAPQIKRNRKGCLGCRRRRKKCNEETPTCGRCQANNEKCEWDSGIRFRMSSVPGSNVARNARDAPIQKLGKSDKVVKATSSPIQFLATSPDVLGKATSIISSGVQIVPGPDPKVDFEALNGQNATTGLDKSILSWSVNHGGSAISSEALPGMNNSSPVRKSSGFLSHSGSEVSLGYDASSTVSNTMQDDSAAIMNRHHIHSLSRSMNDHVRTRERAHDGDNTTRFDESQLQTLDYLTWQPAGDFTSISQADSLVAKDWSSISPPALGSGPYVSEGYPLESPDTYSLDYPNETYKELHMIFRDSMMERAKFTTLTRQGSPVACINDTVVAHADHLQATNRQRDRLQEVAQTADAKSLTPLREMELWRNYVSEICVWLDMFDNCNHFSITLPSLAQSASYLRFSILALSARQLERKQASKPYTESLQLYQEAIQLILPALETLDTAVIASCVLLCVLEMMSSAPRAWARHLDGCAMLMQAAKIHGNVGGVNQALFWCFARMDLWGGFLKDSITKIPINCWFLDRTMAMVVNDFKDASTNLDSYANYMVFLCASVVNVITTDDATLGHTRDRSSHDLKDPYAVRWKALFDVVEDWYRSRPPGMTSIMKAPASSGDNGRPFPIIVHGSSAGANGNQLYHAAAILLLQNKPHEFRHSKSHGSVLWHARQICGIAITNHDHGAWTNAIQPLWIAGRLMSNPAEHAAILSILSKIEQETGFATSWRGQDLQEYWGEIDG